MIRITPAVATLALWGALLAPSSAIAQDESEPEVDAPEVDESDIDDILKTDDTTPQDVGSEREALLEESASPEVPLVPKSKRVIQTLQRKNFMKIGRYEVAPNVGFVTNDPFINRYLLGVSFAYHVTEIFAIELTGTFSPDLGEADYKPITVQIINENQVTPDISKIQFYSTVNFQFSPIYGKVAVLGNNIINFDIFGLFGTGVVNTKDDLEALQTESDEAQATETQLHPAMDFGGGFRISFSEAFAVRLEGRGLSYIEVLESSTLEMKNNMTVLVAASFFFPGMD